MNESLFVLVIGGTDLAVIPGLTVAGADPEAVPLTAPADADLIRFGKCRCVDAVPVDPDGHPTPGIITRAAIDVAHFPVLILRAGAGEPWPPYVELANQVGGDPRKGPALPDAKIILEAAANSAVYCEGRKTVMIGESTPGGTTTALLVLRALGYTEMVSSAGPENPVNMKEEIWAAASKRAGVTVGSLAQDPVRALTEFGDSMQAGALGLAMALPPDVEVILAGGTQMLSVAAMMKHLGCKKLPLVASTKYVADDKSSAFGAMAKHIGVKVWDAPLDFSASPYTGLSDYEKGYVKEGVGCGGACLLAERMGHPISEVIERCNVLYKEWMGK
jgi:uncharacterized protein (TIGR00303 family)